MVKDSTTTATTKSSGKSPTRVSSRPRSPARTLRSTATSPSRVSSKSPRAPPASSTPKPQLSPKARSPIRRQSTRKSPTRSITRSEAASVRTRSQYELDSDSDGADLAPVTKPQATVRGRARLLEETVEQIEVKTQPEISRQITSSSYNLVRRVTRNSQPRDIDRIVPLRHFDTAKKLGEFSDEEIHERSQRTKSTDKVSNDVSEFGGWFGTTFLTVSWPLFIAILGAACTKTQCSFTQLPDWSRLQTISSFFHLTAFLSVLGYAAFLALISILPFGGRKVQGLPTKQGRFQYVMNGPFSLVLCLIIGIGLQVWGIEVDTFIIRHLFHFAVASYILGLIIAFAVYIRSYYVPLSGLNAPVLNRPAIYGFFLGREISPRIFGILDLKMFVLRYGNGGSILLLVPLIYRSLGSPRSFNLDAFQIQPTLLVLSVLLLVYLLDGILREPAWVTSFEIQYEGFGYMSSTGYLVYPYLVALIPKFILDFNVIYPTWSLVLRILVFLVGLTLFIGSNREKDAFRKNPYNPALSHLETISTSKGKKLLCSGYWGIVRHPNYLGDILMNLVFASFVYNSPAVIILVAIVILLVHRSVRDNTRCRNKYGAAWDRYCNRVKYVLIPKVY